MKWFVTISLTAPKDYDADGVTDQLSQALGQLPDGFTADNVDVTDDSEPEPKPEPPKPSRRRTRGEHRP